MLTPRILCAVAAVAGLLVGFACGYWWVDGNRDAAVRTLAEAREQAVVEAARASESLREREAALALAIGPQAGAKYIEELENVKAENDRLLADLRADNVRLRKRWNSCAADRVAQDADAGRELDEAARLRDESAGRIVRAAAECDAQVRGLQGVVVEIHDRVNAQEHNP